METKTALGKGAFFITEKYIILLTAHEKSVKCSSEDSFTLFDKTKLNVSYIFFNKSL